MKNMFFSSVSVNNEERTETFDGFIVIFLLFLLHFVIYRNSLGNKIRFTGQHHLATGQHLCRPVNMLKDAMLR